MDELSLRFSRFFIKHRRINIILIGAATAYFGFEALQLQVFSQFIDLLPRDHPYIQVYEQYNRQFGSANIVPAAIVAQDGTIYDESVLEKIYGFTDQIDKVDGVDHGQVSSIMSIGIRNQEVDREGILRSQQIVGEGPGHGHILKAHSDGVSLGWTDPDGKITVGVLLLENDHPLVVH